MLTSEEQHLEFVRYYKSFVAQTLKIPEYLVTLEYCSFVGKYMVIIDNVYFKYLEEIVNGKT